MGITCFVKQILAGVAQAKSAENYWQ